MCLYIRLSKAAAAASACSCACCDGMAGRVLHLLYMCPAQRTAVAAFWLGIAACHTERLCCTAWMAIAVDVRHMHMRGAAALELHAVYGQQQQGASVCCNMQAAVPLAAWCTDAELPTWGRLREVDLPPLCPRNLGGHAPPTYQGTQRTQNFLGTQGGN